MSDFMDDRLTFKGGAGITSEKELRARAHANRITDDVDKPPHYTQYRGLEIIDLTEQMTFNRGNAVKYICRAGYKGDEDTEVEDLKKAIWYLERELGRLESLGS